MVQITRGESSEERKARAPHLDQLLWSKSKVYVHPTAYARDNIPGFVALTKRVRPCARGARSLTWSRTA